MRLAARGPDNVLPQWKPCRDANLCGPATVTVSQLPPLSRVPAAPTLKSVKLLPRTGSPRSPPLRMTRSRSSNLANWPQLLDANGLDDSAPQAVRAAWGDRDKDDLDL